MPVLGRGRVYKTSGLGGGADQSRLIEAPSVSERLEKKIRKTREALIATPGSDERKRLLKKLHNLEDRARPRTIGKVIPAEAFRLRHKYHK